MELQKTWTPNQIWVPYFLGAKKLERVLIVEDDLSLRPLWLHIIQDFNDEATIDWVTSEEAAEEKLRDRMKRNLNYDLVIADVFLQGQGTGVDLWNRYGDMAKNFVIVSVLPRERFEMLVERELESPIFLEKPLRAAVCKELLESLTA